jgi:hypothetical protein
MTVRSERASGGKPHFPFKFDHCGRRWHKRLPSNWTTVDDKSAVRHGAHAALADPQRVDGWRLRKGEVWRTSIPRVQRRCPTDDVRQL